MSAWFRCDLEALRSSIGPEQRLEGWPPGAQAAGVFVRDRIDP